MGRNMHRDLVGEPNREFAAELMAMFERIEGEIGRDIDRTRDGLKNGLDRGFFDEKKSRVNSQFVAQLGKSLAQRYQITGFGRRGSTRFNIPLEAEQIDWRVNHRATLDWDVTATRGDTRVIEFDTDEGTWMSVDISSDAEWLVFDLLGHIYRMPASGGEARLLTGDSGAALNYHPRISPDGLQIAFVSDRGGQTNLWVMSADGEGARPVFLDPVTRITGPAWLPDGSAIVAVREFPTYSMHRRSARLWQFPLEPGADSPKELVGAPSGTQAYWPAPSPDGRYVYYMQSTFAEPLHGLQRNQHIRRVVLETGEVELVTAPTVMREYRMGSNNELAPEISPDGRYLAFVRRIPAAVTKWRGHTLNARNGFWLLDLVTGEERLLNVPVALDMQGAHGMKNLRILPGYAWAPDSRSLVMWADGGLQRVSTVGKVNPIAFTATIKREVSEQIRARGGIDDRNVISRNLRWPNVSDVHELLVFEAVGEIWRAPLGKKKVEAQLLVPWRPDESYFMPDLAPDGDNLAFIGWNDSKLGSAYRCTLPNCTPEKISTVQAVYRYPKWDAEGETLYVFRSRQDDSVHIAAGGVVHYDLVAIGAEGEHVIRPGLIPAPLSRGPGGRLFYLAREGEVDVQRQLALGEAMPPPRSVLYSFTPGDADEKRAHLIFPDAVAAAPSQDGRRVAYIENFELQVGPLYRNEPLYVRGEANHWEGDAPPQPLIKENPAHRVT